MAEDKKFETVEKPVVKAAPKAETKSVEEQKATAHARLGEILLEYGNLESSIPYSHEYWTLLNVYRAL
jgi:hypothetical protein